MFEDSPMKGPSM